MNTHGNIKRRHVETLEKHEDTLEGYTWKHWIDTHGDIRKNTRVHWKDTRGNIGWIHVETLKGDTRIHEIKMETD